jgi:FkbM family methyltransferase
MIFLAVLFESLRNRFMLIPDDRLSLRELTHSDRTRRGNRTNSLMTSTPARIKSLINRILGFAGLRLVRDGPPSPANLSPEDAGLRQILTHLGITVVFDVGAHVGQYATRLRNVGYRGRIVSFEPQAAAFAFLSQKAMLDPQWEVVRLALGDCEAEQNLNIAENSWSSSFLTASTGVLEIEAGIGQVSKEIVLVKTLDQVCQEFVGPSDRVFLKIDAQGYEPQILMGARSLLVGCSAVQMEMALFLSYQGQKSFPEMMEYMSESGFRLAHLERGFWDARSGFLMEADGIFVRADEIARWHDE